MKLESTSPWLAEIQGVDGARRTFDTPRCAFAMLLSPKAPPSATMRVHEFYTRSLRDASTLRFVIDSDVLGPMGPDLVPVDEERLPKFIADHGGKALASSAVTAETLSNLK